MKRYNLVDNTSGKTERHIEFKGEVLASSDSDDGKAQRWTELVLYRTDTKRYVLESIGRSVVYHADGSTCSRDARPITIQELRGGRGDSEEDLVACSTCNPPDLLSGSVSGASRVLMERDRCTITVAEKAEGIIETLYRTDSVGVRRVSGLAHQLVERAIRNDTAMAAAWSLERV